MNLLADEGADKQIVERLRLEGHDVLYVAEMEPGIADEEVLQRANEHRALLVTEEKTLANWFTGSNWCILAWFCCGSWAYHLRQKPVWSQKLLRNTPMNYQTPSRSFRLAYCESENRNSDTPTRAKQDDDCNA